MIARITAAATALAALAAAGPLAAQTAVFTGQDAAGDRVEDIEEDIADAAERDLPAMGNAGLERGFTGSVALRATATSGNTDTADLGIGARLNYFDGLNGNRFRLSYDYSESNGNVSGDSLLLGYDYTRELGRSAYAFAKVQAAYDDFASIEEDYFVGVGAGYRIFQTRDIAWAVQAGPGYRATRAPGGNWDEDAAYTVGSYYSNRISEGVFVTNDTVAIGSDGDALVTNDLALNVALAGNLALRTSLLTEYRTDPLPGFEEVDNKLGVSVVYTFD